MCVCVVSGSLRLRTYLRLVYKKGDREDLTNWRPITLLNTDYKIIARVFFVYVSIVYPVSVHP